MNKFFSSCAALAFALGTAAGANAQVVNFEDNAAQVQNQLVVSDGYSFAQPDCCQYSWAGGQNADNGTTFLIYGFGTTTMTKVGGGTFDVSSLDAGISFYLQDAGYIMSLVGTHADNSTVMTSLGLTSSFQTYTLGGFTNLVSLSFSGTGDGYFALDNINSVAATPAPEPASWALMLGGFGLVGGAMRSRRKAAVSFG